MSLTRYKRWKMSTHVPGPKGLILLVDDNEGTGFVVQTMLELMEFEVQRAFTGRQGVEEAYGNSYVAVLMDIEMPDMDGIDATKAIRKNEQDNQRAAVTIIGISSHTSRGIQVLCQLAGMNHYLSTPFLMEQLQEMLGSVDAPAVN